MNDLGYDGKPLPPHDIDAEEAVIGSLLIDGNAVRFVENLVTTRDFYAERTGGCYEACLNLRSRREQINSITVAQELHRLGKLERCGGAAYLSHAIANCPTSLDILYYAEIVRRTSVARSMIRLGGQVVDMSYHMSPNVNEALAKLVAIVSDFQKSVVKMDELVSPKDAGNVIFDMIDEYNNPPKTMAWGFRDLDELTGGIYPEFVIVGGRPSIGKTQIMLDIMENVVRQQYKVLFCSAEMMVRALMERKIARELKVDIRRLRGYGLDEDLMEKLAELAGIVSEQQVYYMPQGVSSQEIYAEASKMKSTIGLDIVFVDYLQILKDCWQSGGENKNVLVGRASKVLKSIVNDLNVPVICASQLNRDLERRPEEQRRPNLADLRESGDIEQDSDVVFLLYRDINNADTSISNQLEVKMAKNRQLGDAPAVKLIWLPNEHRYVDGYQG